jgi:hypothetical protein
LTAAAARRLTKLCVDNTLRDHYDKCVPPGVDPPADCRHSTTLVIARWIEANLTVGKTRASLDLPADRDVMRALRDRVSLVSEHAKQSKSAFKLIVDTADKWLNRHPLEILADTVVDQDG